MSKHTTIPLKHEHQVARWSVEVDAAGEQTEPTRWYCGCGEEMLLSPEAELDTRLAMGERILAILNEIGSEPDKRSGNEAQ